MSTELGLRLRHLRDQRGLTQEELAQKVGVSRQTLHNIESGGTQSPRAYLLYDLARELGVSGAYLLGRDEGMHGDDLKLRVCVNNSVIVLDLPNQDILEDQPERSVQRLELEFEVIRARHSATIDHLPAPTGEE